MLFESTWSEFSVQSKIILRWKILKRVYKIESNSFVRKQKKKKKWHSRSNWSSLCPRFGILQALREWRREANCGLKRRRVRRRKESDRDEHKWNEWRRLHWVFTVLLFFRCVNTCYRWKVLRSKFHCDFIVCILWYFVFFTCLPYFLSFLATSTLSITEFWNFVLRPFQPIQRHVSHTHMTHSERERIVNQNTPLLLLSFH